MVSMRPIPPALTLGVLLWSPCAWPCTQAFTLGETRPREQEVYPSNGQLWLSFSGPSDALVGLIRGPDLADTALELTRVGPDLVTARLPPLTVGSTYELELTSPAQGLAKQVRFVAGADPDPRPPEPPPLRSTATRLTCGTRGSPIPKARSTRAPLPDDAGLTKPTFDSWV